MKLQKKRILVVGESVSLAHIARPLYLAESLDPNEYEIHFACDKQYQSFIDDNSFQFWPINSIPSDDFLDAQTKGGYVPSVRNIESNIEEDLALISKVSPSIIINDLRFSMTISAETTKTPYATLANAHWSPYRNLGYDPFPYSNSDPNNKLSRNNGPKGPSATENFNKIREKYTLTKLGDYCDLATRGDYTLYTEPQGFIPTKDRPDTHIFIGPILWEPKTAYPSWWRNWNEELPIIYITLGSTGASEFLENIIESIQELPLSIIAATAGRSSITNIHPNVFIADYLPGIEISKIASLVICNGGSATAYQALSQGAPLLGFWSNIDQYLTIKNIERIGAGVGIQAKEIEFTRVKVLVSEILNNNSFQVKSKEIQKLFSHFNAKESFNDFLK